MKNTAFTWVFPSKNRVAILELVHGECLELFTDREVVYRERKFNTEPLPGQMAFVQNLEKLLTTGNVRLSIVRFNHEHKSIFMQLYRSTWNSYYKWQVERELRELLGKNIAFTG